jgi:hypothetical protein
MSYPADLDEISTGKLRAELERRDAMRKNCRCTYCERQWKLCQDKPCKLGPRDL